MRGAILEIDHSTAVDFLLPRHYSGRIPPISVAFGWYRSRSTAPEDLVAVVTFGKPASPWLCKGVCGEEYAHQVYELNRLCRVDDWDEPLSAFVSACLRRLRWRNWIVVSFSDTAMEHHGYIYQACNFIYTGCTKPRTDKYVPDGKHARHYTDADQACGLRTFRSAKHRYIYFCTHDRRLRAQWVAALKYPPKPYPKGDNAEDYILGEYLKPTYIKEESAHA